MLPVPIPNYESIVSKWKGHSECKNVQIMNRSNFFYGLHNFSKSYCLLGVYNMNEIIKLGQNK